MPPDAALVCGLVFVAVLVGIFALLPDERPERPGISDRERALRWLYERLLLSILAAAMVAAMLVAAPYQMARELEIELDPVPGAAKSARDSIAEVLGDSLGRDTVKDLQLIVSELVGNSVRHGPGNRIGLRISIDDDGRVHGEVADQGDGTVAMREMGAKGGGRGLHIVDALAERWAVYEGSTHIWFELSADAGSAGS
jgi:anti-sigma regulatory factor (Ser/Thr protein kinase)